MKKRSGWRYGPLMLKRYWPVEQFAGCYFCANGMGAHEHIKQQEQKAA